MRKDEGLTPDTRSPATSTATGNAEDMYRDHILEHYKNPRNFGILEPADIDHSEDNPLCGDDIRITIRLSSGAERRVEDVRFQGRGCAISQASASLLTTKVLKMSLPEIRALTKEDVLAMLGVPVSPVRLKCALLSLVVLQDGVTAFETRG
ncbi:MAG: iron-sulfur cluster assembly scaffold protein [Thermoplasmatota archaeon]